MQNPLQHFDAYNFTAQTQAFMSFRVLERLSVLVKNVLRILLLVIRQKEQKYADSKTALRFHRRIKDYHKELYFVTSYYTNL